MAKILLIEDSGKKRESLKKILELSQYEVTTAKDGKEGVKEAEQKLPDLVVCNISKFSTPDGYDVLKILSANSATSHIPFIFISEKEGDYFDFRRVMDLGAADYLAKPFDKIELMNTIEIQLKKSGDMAAFYSKNFTASNNFGEGLNKDLKATDLFKQLLDKGDVHFYKKKEEIYKEGSYPKGIYYVNKGKVLIYKLNDFGKELITNLYKEGDFFGIVPLLHGKSYLSAIAMEDAEISLIPKDDFYQLIYNDMRIMKIIINYLTNILCSKEEQLVKFTYNSVRKKVADALIFLYDKYKNEPDTQSVSISLPRENLAQIAGVATETAIRTLSDLKKEKLIDINGNTIVILNYDKLKNLYN